MQAKPQAPATAEPAPAVAARQRIGRCELDLESRRLFEAGEEVAMTAMEFELLRVFLANPNRVLSRDQLLMRTRNREWEPFDRSIDIRIGRLRRKIEPDPAGEPRCIRTVRNGGYMYVPAAARAFARAASVRPSERGSDCGSTAERIGEHEHHRDADADQEVGVDQSGQQEHLDLQPVHQFRLPCRAFDVLAAHQADADARADRAEPDDEPAGQRHESDDAHLLVLFRLLFLMR